MYEFHFDNAGNVGPGSVLYLNFFYCYKTIYWFGGIFCVITVNFTARACVYMCVSRTLYHVYVYICYLTFGHPPTYYTLCIKTIFSKAARGLMQIGSLLL